MSKSIIVGCLMLLFVGCGRSSNESQSAAPNDPVLPSAEPAIEPPMQPGNAATAEETMERVEAQAGVGQRGRSLDNETGVGAVIAEPAKALFSFQEKAVFDIQIPQAMQLFKATEGRLPNSDQEFMDKIVRANNIRLPELPEGQRYVFDPQRGELMVERPSR